MKSPEVFGVRDQREGLHALEALSARFPTRLHAEETLGRVYYDTFDWRLLRSGQTLSLSEAGWLALESLAGEAPRRLRADGPPRFVHELPPGPIRERLAAVVEPRRLLPRVVTREERRTLDILDAQGKTTCRAILEGGVARLSGDARSNGEVPAPGLPPRLRLVALRGYEDALPPVVRACREELGLGRAASHGLELALATCGGVGEDPSSVRVELDGDAPAEDAVRAVLAAILDVLEANEEGTRRELDVEFLHDFRVALRRTRSILRSLGDVFDPAAVEPFVAELRWLGGLTGPARDLDVLLHELSGHALSGKGALRELEDWLRARRSEQQELLLEALDSGRYRRFLAAWRAFLEQAPARATASASEPVRELVRGRLGQLTDELLARGRRIRPETKAGKLHRIRIRAKEVRYLLDAFRSLWGADELARALRRLKKLQDVLGRFNDLTVQREALRRHALEMGERGVGSAATFLEIGRLREQSRRASRRVRRRVAQRMARFAREGKASFEPLLEGSDA